MHTNLISCAMNGRDIPGIGTFFRPEKHQRGGMLEISWNGTEAERELPDGRKAGTFSKTAISLVMRGM